MLDRLIPAGELAAVRESVLAGRAAIKEALPHGTWTVVPLGLGRVVALHHRSSALYQIQ